MKRISFNPKLSWIVLNTIAATLLPGLSGTGCMSEAVKGTPVTCELSESAFHFPFEGGEQPLTVTSNAIGWEATCDAAWITLTPSKGAGTATVQVRAAANAESTGLAATVTVVCTGIPEPQTVSVSIDAAALLTVSPSTLSFAATDTPKQLTVASNTNWTAGKSADWLTVSPASGTNNGTLNVAVADNTGTEQRTASVSVASPGLTPRTVSVTQAGAAPFLTVSPDVLSFTVAGASQTFSVASNTGWEVSAGSASWLTVAPPSGSGAETVTVTAAANTNAFARQAAIAVSGAGVQTQNIDVTQAGTNPALEMQMVYVAGGSFTMGCTAEQGGDCEADETAHSVTLGDFYIGRYEVTVAQVRAVVGGGGDTGTDGHPVTASWNFVVGTAGASMTINNITYYENGFIYRLNRMTGKQYRLPTEAEWEYAARGGSSGGFRYSGSNTVESVAWYSGNSGGNTHPAGTKAPNSLGIFDMSGNASEWCSDWYSQGYYSISPQNNPQGPASGTYRAIRGGNCFQDAGAARVSARSFLLPESGSGFRLASGSNN